MNSLLLKSVKSLKIILTIDYEKIKNEINGANSSFTAKQLHKLNHSKALSGLVKELEFLQ